MNLQLSSLDWGNIHNHGDIQEENQIHLPLQVLLYLWKNSIRRQSSRIRVDSQTPSPVVFGHWPPPCLGLQPLQLFSWMLKLHAEGLYHFLFCDI